MLNIFPELLAQALHTITHNEFEQTKSGVQTEALEMFCMKEMI